jgi:hypothetical protein
VDLPELAVQVDRILGIGDPAELPVEGDRGAEMLALAAIGIAQVAQITRDEGSSRLNPRSRSAS